MAEKDAETARDSEQNSLSRQRGAAKRALAEAAERRRAQELGKIEQDKEFGGSSRRFDPTRFGDWELKGRAIDF